MPNSSCEECWSPEHAVPSQDSKAYDRNVDSSTEVPGHSYRSRPVEASISSILFWNECEQNKEESISPEDKEDGKY